MWIVAAHLVAGFAAATGKIAKLSRLSKMVAINGAP